MMPLQTVRRAVVELARHQFVARVTQGLWNVDVQLSQTGEGDTRQRLRWERRHLLELWDIVNMAGPRWPIRQTPPMASALLLALLGATAAWAHAPEDLIGLHAANGVVGHQARRSIASGGWLDVSLSATEDDASTNVRPLSVDSAVATAGDAMAVGPFMRERNQVGFNEQETGGSFGFEGGRDDAARDSGACPGGPYR